MFENVEILIDLAGTISLVIPASESYEEPVFLESVRVDEPFAPQE